MGVWLIPNELKVVISHPTERVRRTRIRRELAWTIDNRPPRISLQADAPATSCEEVIVEAKASEATEDFNATSIHTTNCHVESFEGSGRNYRFTLIPDAPGEFSAFVPAGAFHDAASNRSKQSNSIQGCSAAG